MSEVRTDNIEEPKIIHTTDPNRIMQVGMGFWASKALLAAIRFRLFTLLAAGAKPGLYIKEKLHFQTTDRHLFDWLDSLVSLGFLHRDGILEDALYSNTTDSNIFLDHNKSSYIGGMLEMANNRLYNFWANLEEALLTGKAQNEVKSMEDADFFTELYKDPEKLQEFVNAMSGLQMDNFMALVQKFDFKKYNSLADIGGADGFLSIQICLNYPHIHCYTFDLPQVESLAKKKIAQFNLNERIFFIGGDLMKDDLPPAEIITMGNLLHGMTEQTKQNIFNKIFNSLPEGGVFIAIENVIDNERKKNTFGLLMSLNMLIENGDAFDYTYTDFEKWAINAGFSRTEILPLAGPTSAAIAYK